jgi:hypothetical protein
MELLNHWGFMLTRGFYNRVLSLEVRRVTSIRNSVSDLIFGVSRHSIPELLYTHSALRLGVTEFSTMRSPDYRQAIHARTKGLTIFSTGTTTGDERGHLHDFIYYRTPDVIFIVGVDNYMSFRGVPHPVVYSTKLADVNSPAARFIKECMYDAGNWMQFEYA